MRWAGWALAFAVGIGTVGCGRKSPAQTASVGMTGCAEADIAISEEVEKGDARTWVATCHGVRYRCSTVTTSSSSWSWTRRHSTTAGCQREQGPSGVAQGNAEPDVVQAPAEKVGALSKTEKPKDVLGFQFGDSVAKAKQACIDATHEWLIAEGGFSCSGAPKDVSLPVHASLGFCDDALCRMSVVLELNPESQKADDDLKGVVLWLKSKYGQPAIDRPRFPQDCHTSLVACIARGKASWNLKWRWPNGDELDLRTFASEGKVGLVAYYAVAPARAPSKPPAPTESLSVEAF